MFRLIKSVFHSAWRGAGRSITSDPEVRGFLARHPKLVRFIRRRLTADEEFGIYLTVGTLATAIFAYLFFGVTVDLIGQQPVLQSDLNIINLLQVLRGGAFNHVMLAVTDLGEWPVIFVGVAAVGGVLAYARRRYSLTTLIVSVVGAEAFAWLVSRLVVRPRPELVNVLVHANGSSFPSSHVLLSVAFYGLLAYFLFRLIPSRRWHWLAVAGGMLLLLAIGFSRVYLGAHWPSDVFASFAAGAAWLTVLVTAMEIRRRYHYKTISKANHVRRRLAGAIMIAGTFWMAFYVGYFFAHPLRTVEAEDNMESFFMAPEDIQSKFFTDLPRTSESLTGLAKEPINVIVIATRGELDRSFMKAGWMLTDKLNSQSLFRAMTASLTNGPYPTGPGIPSFWDGRPNDFAYEQSTLRQTIRERHHIHIWSTPFITTGDRRIWVGTAHYDKGIKLNSSFFVPVHAIDPALDKERQKVASDLAETGLAESETLVHVVDPMLGKNETGDTYFTDGQAELIILK